MKHLATALEAHKEKPLAIIIKGNPKYLNDHKVKPLAVIFYYEVQALLEAKGYRVEFDNGEPFTRPHDGAAVWVAHSRGIDRLRFAPKNVKTIALQTRDAEKKHKTKDEIGHDPLHYQLSTTDMDAIGRL